MSEFLERVKSKKVFSVGRKDNKITELSLFDFMLDFNSRLPECLRLEVSERDYFSFYVNFFPEGYFYDVCDSDEYCESGFLSAFDMLPFDQGYDFLLNNTFTDRLDFNSIDYAKVGFEGRTIAGEQKEIEGSTYYKLTRYHLYFLFPVFCVDDWTVFETEEDAWVYLFKEVDDLYDKYADEQFSTISDKYFHTREEAELYVFS